MNADPASLISGLAENYRLCLADWPTALKAEDLAAPPGEQEALLGGLAALHALIGGVYGHFARLAPEGECWADREECCRAIERPLKLLWALGVHGRVLESAEGTASAKGTAGAEGTALHVSRDVLNRAMKPWSAKEAAADLAVLEAVGLTLAYYGADGQPCLGYKACATLSMRSAAGGAPLLRALSYFAARLPATKKGRTNTGPLITVFMRADFRPLLPGYTHYNPHLPATEGEVTRTMDPATLELWQALKDFMASRYPRYGLYYRVPSLHNRGWVTDYSRNGKDYGEWSILADEGGLYVRIVLGGKGLQHLAEHIDQLSPAFQESYLNGAACKDCVKCGKHAFFTHGDHTHRLCKNLWYVSPYLHMEDLPDIERLIDIRLAG